MSNKTIWNYLISQTGNEYGVAGLMGNLHAESALRSNNLQNSGNNRLGMSDEEYTKAVDNGTYTDFVEDGKRGCGYGLAQWTYWSRKENLLNFAKSKGASIGDENMQLEFLVMELKRDFKTVWNTLCSAHSVKEASDSVLCEYEKPADQSDTAKARRASYGQKFYDEQATGYVEASYIDYEIQSGDNLSKIAEKYGTTVQAIVDANNIINPDIVYAGDPLKIPVSANIKPPVAIKVGDKVKVKSGVTTFSNGKKMASWVPKSILYVRQIEKDGAIYLVSTQAEGNSYTGRVNSTDVEKI